MLAAGNGRSANVLNSFHLRVLLGTLCTRSRPLPQDPKALLCHCHGVNYATVQRVIDENSCVAIDQVTRICRAGGGCRSCHVEIYELIQASVARRNGFWKRLWQRIRN